MQEKTGFTPRRATSCSGKRECGGRIKYPLKKLKLLASVFAAGFTLIELLVVVMILGILAGVVVPSYYKALENSRSKDAVGLVMMVATANRMYKAEYNRSDLPYLAGLLDDRCNTGACMPTGTDNPDVCDLVHCSYMSAHSWGKAYYEYYACNLGQGGGCCAAGPDTVACAIRKSPSNSDGTGTDTSPYRTWGYHITDQGQCVPDGGAPPCPSM